MKNPSLPLTHTIDKLGTAGLLLTALFSPCCFPLFAFAASALGLGSFELFGGWTMWVFQAMVVISVGGLVLSYLEHRRVYPLLLAVVSGLSICYGYHLTSSDHWVYFLYAGMFGLLVATAWNYRLTKLHGACDTCTTYNDKTVELQSTLTCPTCAHQATELMPTDACVYFYECAKCHTRLKPLPGDCCVYCSYGTVKCPPIQAGGSCC